MVGGEQGNAGCDGKISWKSSIFLYLNTSISINVAYNYDSDFFEIVNNSMVEYPPFIQSINVKGLFSYILYDFEILEIFFKSYVIAVNWIDCNYTWGWYDDETGRWTGAVGKVRMNEYMYFCWNNSHWFRLKVSHS